jgi:predicted ATPase
MAFIADPLGSAQAGKDDERRLTFDRQVREALVHLNDLAALQRLPLGNLALPVGITSGPTDAKALQQTLRNAIAALRPPAPADPVAPIGRSYHLLTLRYVEGLEVASLLPKLAIGRSEYYRDHRRALAELSDLLWERWQGATRPDRPRPLTNLPASLSSFIGRERELADVARALTTNRLLTLTGTGGCGKTRLACELAREVDSYHDGVWLVELAPLAEPELLAQAVATALGLHECVGQSLLQVLTTYLQGKDLLLLLDNCEHLIEAVAQLVHALLRSCPRLTILATSREALRLAGEVTWRVPSLPLPSEIDAAVETIQESDAVRLFVERARALQPHFALTNVNAPALAQVCRRLDGIPLAIELAAALVRVLSVEQIAQRLDDRFHLLTTGGRDALPRHRTLQATLDWSYALLNKPEQTLFRRLSVFAGSFGLEAAETVGGGEAAGCSVLSIEASGEEVIASTRGAQHAAPSSAPFLELLTRLVDKSLVVVEQGARATRYRLLETVRQYGWERLVEAEEAAAARDRHRDWCMALAERARPGLRGAQQQEWRERLEVEHDNLRAALTWSLESDPMVGVRLAGSLWRFWQQRGYYAEGRRWLEAALAGVGPAGRHGGHTLCARALIGAGLLARDQGESPVACAFVEASLALFREAGDPRGVADALRVLGYCRLDGGEPAERVRPLLEESLSRAMAMGDQRGVAVSLVYLGILCVKEQDDPQVRHFLTDAVAIFRQIGDAMEVSDAVRTRGFFALGRGELPEACRDLEEALEIARRIGHKRGAGLALLALGYIAHEAGDRTGARKLLEEGARLLREAAAPGTHQFLGYLGQRAVERGQSARGVRLLATAAGRPENGLFPILLPSAHPRARAAAISAARAALGEEAFAVAWAEGQAMTLEQALDYALTAETN